MPTIMEPRSQDYLVDAGNEGERHRGNLLVHDLMSLNCKLWLLAGKEPSKSDQTAVAKHIVNIIHDGSSYTLPSSIAASESFFTGGGRFLKKEDDSWKEISDAAATKLLAELIEEEVQFLDKAGYAKEVEAQAKSTDKGEAKGSDTDTEEEVEKEEKEEEQKQKPRRDKRQKTNSGQAAAPPSSSQEEERVVTTKPNTDDVVLLDRKDSTEKTYVDHAGNAFLILEVSQFFTDQYMLSKAAIKGTRADAALATVYSLLGPIKSVGEDGTTVTKTRFLLRPKDTSFLRSKKDTPETWEVLTYTEAAEFVLMLLFDKLVDKENIAASLENTASAEATLGPSTVPVKNFTDHDVLFGRGGLTNTHPGNRRFRDIILLHRPDYVRAVKIEKPNVARRIVRAIRYGPSPGRFLKKDAKNGMWYDVGDRHAAEKTSQALREKTQAEKAARFDEDKRKRLREGGLSQLASQRGARMYPVLPLPALSPADLQKMVQAPFGVNLAGAPMVGAYGVPGMPAAMPPNGDKATASPNCAKPAVAASVAAASVAAAASAAAGGDDDQKIAAQDRFDSEGNILVTDSDVIAGRGGRSNHHKGNKRFRDIVALHRPDYVRAAKIHKPAVARMIVRALRNSDPPGRFLKKDEKTGKWYDIGDKKAAEKASQALREKTPEERDRLKTDGGLPPSYFTNTALFQATSAMIRNGIPGLGGPVGMPLAGVAAATPATPVPTVTEGQQPAQEGAPAAKEQSDSSPSKKGKETADAVEAV